MKMLESKTRPKSLIGKNLLGILCLVLAQSALAGRTLPPGSGSLDTTFDTDGKVIIDLGNYFDSATSLAIQADGKVLTAGLNKLIRLNANGSLDTLFGASGIVTTAMDQSYGTRALALQADGKILVSGVSGSQIAVARYHLNGSADVTFGINGLATAAAGIAGSTAYAIAIQTDGKIVLAGEARNYLQYPCDGRGSCDYDDDLVVVRFNIDGTLDTRFGNSGVVTTPIGTSTQGDIGARGVAIQADGKIVVAGYVEYVTGRDILLARYHSTNGALDSTFGGMAW